MALRPLVAGNWKMNGKRASLAEIAKMGRAYDAGLRARIDLLVCPPATLIEAAAAVDPRIAVGAQDCHDQAFGAFTGEISAEMLADVGATYVIVGHSERRRFAGESDARVLAKSAAAARAGLTPIVCIGETLEERQAGRELDVLRAQIEGSVPHNVDLVVAYEPIWAIGTGLTPSAAEIGAAHAIIRQELERKTPGLGARTRILYGGSVKPSNAAELLGAADVDGALVGGASLEASEFMAICGAYR